MIRLMTLVRWEWFKLRHRWMPWILLAIFLLFSQLAVWANFFAYRSFENSGGDVTLTAGAGQDVERMVVRCGDVLSGDSARLPTGLDPALVEDLREQCAEQELRREEQLGRMRRAFTLPGSITTALSVVQPIGLVLMAILTASVFGVEYNWGTLRPFLARGEATTWLASLSSSCSARQAFWQWRPQPPP